MKEKALLALLQAAEIKSSLQWRRIPSTKWRSNEVCSGQEPQEHFQFRAVPSSREKRWSQSIQWTWSCEKSFELDVELYCWLFFIRTSRGIGITEESTLKNCYSMRALQGLQLCVGTGSHNRVCVVSNPCHANDKIQESRGQKRGRNHRQYFWFAGTKNTILRNISLKAEQGHPEAPLNIFRRQGYTHIECVFKHKYYHLFDFMRGK